MPRSLSFLNPRQTHGNLSGVPWNVVVFAQTSDQVTSGATRQSTHNSSFPASPNSSVATLLDSGFSSRSTKTPAAFPIRNFREPRSSAAATSTQRTVLRPAPQEANVDPSMLKPTGLPGSTALTPSLSTGDSSTETTLEIDSGPTGTSLPQDTSVGMTVAKKSVLPFTSSAKTRATPASLVQERATQSLKMIFSVLPASTARETASSEQTPSPTSSPRANGTPSGNSSTEIMVPRFGSLRISSIEGTFTREASTDTHIAEPTNSQVAYKYTDISAMEDNRTESTWDTKHLPAVTAASTETNRDLTVSKKIVPMSMISSETTTADSHALGNTNPLLRTLSSSLFESSPIGTSHSWGDTGLELNQLNNRHPFSSPEPSFAGDMKISVSVPLLSSASALGDKVSGSSTFSVQRVTSSMTTGAPESTKRTEPNSVVSLSRTLSTVATSTKRVRSATSSPSGEGTAGSVHALSTSSETTDIPTIPTARDLASEWSGGPRTVSITSVTGVKATSPTTSVSQETHTHLSTASKENKETLNAPMALPETSGLRRENSLATTSVLTPGFITADSKVTSSTQVFSSDLLKKLRNTHSTSARHSTNTVAPESFVLPRTPLSTTPMAVSWSSVETVQHYTESQQTQWTVTGTGTETVKIPALTGVPAFTTLSTYIAEIPGFNTPETVFSKGTSQRETSTDTLNIKATTGPESGQLTLPTGISVTKSSSRWSGWSTAHLPTGTTVSSEIDTDLHLTMKPDLITTSPVETRLASSPNALRGRHPSFEVDSLTYPVTSPREIAKSREQKGSRLITRHAGHDISSPESTSAGDIIEITSVPPLPSASTLGEKESGFSTFSVRTVTSSMTTENHHKTTERTEPNSAVSLSTALSPAATSADRVRSTRSSLAVSSPSGPGTAGSIHTLRASSEATGMLTIPTAGTSASEWPGGPGTLSITSTSRAKATSPSDSQETHTHLPMTGNKTKENLNASVSAPETFPGKENNSATTLDPTPRFTSAESRLTSATQVPSTHPLWMLRTTRSTAAPEDSELSRMPMSLTPTTVSWTSADTAQDVSDPRHTWSADTSPGMKTSIRVAAPVTTSLVSLVVSGATTPRTSSTEAASPRETSSDALTVATTTGPTTDQFIPPTGISATSGSSTRRNRGPTHLLTGGTASSETATDLTSAMKSASVFTSTAETVVASSSSGPGGTSPSLMTVSSEMPETLSTGNPDSRAGTSWGLTTPHTGHHFSSHEPASAGDIMEITSVPPLPSASTLGDKVSGFSTFSVRTVTSSMTTETHKATERTEPNSAVSLSTTLSPAATSADRVRSTRSSLAVSSPSAPGTAGSIHTLSASSEATGTLTIPTAGTSASEWPSDPRTLSLASDFGMYTTFSPSIHSTLLGTNIRAFTPADVSKGNLNSSVSPESSASRMKSTLAFTAAPTQDFSTMDTQTSLTPLSFSSHLVSELRASSNDSVTDSINRALPKTSHLLKILAFASTAMTSQANIGSFNYSTAPRNSTGSENSTKAETAPTTVSASASSLSATMGITRSTSPTTRSMEGTSFREPTIATFMTETISDLASGFSTVSTNIASTMGYDNERRLRTTQMPTGTTTSSETSTDLTLAKESIPVSISSSQSMGAPSSSTPGGESQLVGTFSDSPYHLTTGEITFSVSQPLTSQMVAPASSEATTPGGQNGLSSESSVTVRKVGQVSSSSASSLSSEMTIPSLTSLKMGETIGSTSFFPNVREMSTEKVSTFSLASGLLGIRSLPSLPGTTSSMGIWEDAGTSSATSLSSSSSEGEINSSIHLSSTVNNSPDPFDLSTRAVPRASSLDPTTSTWISSEAFSNIQAQTSYKSPEAISFLGSPGTEHTILRVETGLAKTLSGELTSSESKREPPWTSTSSLSEAPINRGTAGTVESTTNVPIHESFSWLRSDRSTPMTAVYSAGLPTGGIERAETTTTAILTTRVSTPTLGMPTLLRTSSKTSSTSTTGMIVTTPDVSPDVLEMTAALATRPGAETSTAFSRTTPSMFNRESETTPTLVLSSWAETSSAVPTLAVSFGEPEATTSRVTHPVQVRPTVSRATLNVSHSKSDSTLPTATSSGEKVSLTLPTLIVSPSIPGMVTSLVISPGAETSMFIPTLTSSTDESETTDSWITHPGVQSSSSTATSTVSPSLPGLVTSPDTSSGAETSPVVQILTDSPDKPDTTVSLVSHPGAKTNSAISTLTLSSCVSEVEISQVTSSRAETSTTFPTLTDSLNEPETADIWVTHPEVEANSIVPTITVSPYEPDTTTSLVHSAETSTPVSRKTPIVN
ncbi:mucin-16-like isoform X2 [Pteropus medius]|uniref:mucin-16-like isoform X2 n=1 Tax=Pteropus vampyrus TaxID=132908 RepID=UPI00196B21F1|nr:mucin-16-like isoform X2 [Pteropus giganteus]